MKGFHLGLFIATFLVALVVGTQDDNEESKLWVLLVAGSYSYWNYRHQADVCHSYQVIKDHGVDPENIIVMMRDDIANNSMNPLKGKIINQPNGPDVYHGVPKDYNKEHNNPKVFLDVLQGINPGVGSGRVIKSGPKDRIFVYFADHGAPGLIAFGEQYLYATQLNEAINKMHQEKKYGQMVFYIEACESGSMFEKLKDNINVFATTAANASSSSYACYYDHKLNNFLGDVYSIKWLQDSDKSLLTHETLEKQFETVKRETNTSTVCQFGEKSMSKLPLSVFQGKKKSGYKPPKVPAGCGENDQVKIEEVPLKIVERRGNPFEINLFHAKRSFFNSTFQKIFEEFSEISLEQVIEDRESYVLNEDRIGQCYQKLVDSFNQECFNIAVNEYALRFMFAFIHLCENNIEAEQVVGSMKANCKFDSTIHGRIV